jgi:hypothetical protein
MESQRFRGPQSGKDETLCPFRHNNVNHLAVSSFRTHSKSFQQNSSNHVCPRLHRLHTVRGTVWSLNITSCKQLGLTGLQLLVTGRSPDSAEENFTSVFQGSFFLFRLSSLAEWTSCCNSICFRAFSIFIGSATSNLKASKQHALNVDDQFRAGSFRHPENSRWNNDFGCPQLLLNPRRSRTAVLTIEQA